MLSSYVKNRARIIPFQGGALNTAERFLDIEHDLAGCGRGKIDVCAFAIGAKKFELCHRAIGRKVRVNPYQKFTFVNFIFVLQR